MNPIEAYRARAPKLSVLDTRQTLLELLEKHLSPASLQTLEFKAEREILDESLPIHAARRFKPGKGYTFIIHINGGSCRVQD